MFNFYLHTFFKVLVLFVLVILCHSFLYYFSSVGHRCNFMLVDQIVISRTNSDFNVRSTCTYVLGMMEKSMPYFLPFVVVSSYLQYMAFLVLSNITDGHTCDDKLFWTYRLTTILSLHFFVGPGSEGCHLSSMSYNTYNHLRMVPIRSC